MPDPGPTLKALLPRIRELVVSARRLAAHTVNTLQVVTSYEIGRLIVEHEQGGAERADYGKALLKQVASSLTMEFGRGFSLTNLKRMRQFYLTHRSQIGQTPSGLFPELQKSQTLSGRSGPLSVLRLPKDLPAVFRLSWSHCVFLLSVKDDKERSFYAIESAKQGWSLRELRRQFDSSLYERLALSRDKDAVRRMATEGHTVEAPRDLLKSPLVLEFLGLEEKAAYSESDLETAIIDKIERFLLELGTGFLFEARQKRFTLGEEHFHVDLVFYNRLLRCYVLVDLKIGRLTHQDLGQMQMYVNHFDRSVKLPDEHPTIGVILCKKKNDALVEITLPKDASIYASEYQLYLPSKEELRQKLLDWAAEAEE